MTGPQTVNSSKIPTILCFCGIILVAVSWHFPGAMTCALLSILGALLITGYIHKVESPYKVLYSAGCGLYAIGFYWLFFTIRDFGFFGNFAALSIFVFFVLVSALQFLIFAFLFKFLPNGFTNAGIGTALAWVAAERLSLKIFPWCLGHSQLALTFFAQTADIAGAQILSFFLIYYCESFWKIVRTRRINFSSGIALLLLVFSIIYGAQRAKQIHALDLPSQPIALVQANVSLEDKHNSKMFSINKERYLELTKSITTKNTLIVWPESVITEWIFAGFKSVQEDRQGRVPYYPQNSLLVGSLTFESPKRIYNSALAVTENGAILPVYHKQILMPFGEFTPFSDYLPWLKEINATAAEFSAGQDVAVFDYPKSDGGVLRVAPLICYEDIDPALAHQATKKGAQLLVNITNDAWFGETVASAQHNLIAAFRAIENRRYLLRSTNTGLTTVINPLGQTVKSLPVYSDGILETKVTPLDVKSPAQFFNFEKFWLYLSLLVLTFALLGRLRKKA